MLRVVVRHKITAEMCSTDAANVFGTLYRETVLAAIGIGAHQLLPFFGTAWLASGTMLWTRRPAEWHRHNVECRKNIIGSGPVAGGTGEPRSLETP